MVTFPPALAPLCARRGLVFRSLAAKIHSGKIVAKIKRSNYHLENGWLIRFALK